MPLTPPGPHLAGPPRPEWAVEEVAGCPYGVLVCAVSPEPIPRMVAAALHPAERQHAASLTPRRRREWVAGRHCLGDALNRVGASRTPLLPQRFGAPDIPATFAGSISHKGPFTVAIATNRYRAIGLDVEHAETRDVRLISKVFTNTERAAVADHPSQHRLARLVAFHFAVKEAVYKAIDSCKQSSIEFLDIELESGPLPRFLPEASWTMQHISVHAAPWRTPVAVLTEGDWVLAVAARR